MMERSTKPLGEIAYCYLGDARNNMGNSLLVIGCKLGMDVRICAPEACGPARAGEHAVASRSPPRPAQALTLTEDVAAGVKGVDFVHTDVWVSMGEPVEVWDERIKLLKPYQVNMDVMKAAGNPQAKFMHCLPAFHNRETKVGEQIFQKYGHGWPGSDRRRVRVALLGRLRPGGEPHAHHQGDHGGDAGRLSVCYVTPRRQVAKGPLGVLA
jgi:ornithine carbamoyltransferase